MSQDWRDLVERLDVDAAVLLRDAPLTSGLELIGWKVHHEQDGSVIVLPPDEHRIFDG